MEHCFNLIQMIYRLPVKPSNSQYVADFFPAIWLDAVTTFTGINTRFSVLFTMNLLDCCRFFDSVR